MLPNKIFSDKRFSTFDKIRKIDIMGKMVNPDKSEDHI